MAEIDPNEITATGPDSPHDRRDNGRNSETNRPTQYPYGDTGNLYEIPRIRPEDPPMRKWWIDDEQQ